jgi:multiple sugar transport system permease protein
MAIAELGRMKVRIGRPAGKRGGRRMPRHLVVENYWAFAFLALSLIGLLGLTLLPIVISFGLSFTDWDALGAPQFVGLRNFIQLFQDRTFYRALWNTIYYTLVSVPLGMSISLALALVLNRSLPGMGLFRTLFLIPVISSTVATALLWGLMLDPYIGLVNFMLQALHLPTSGWLSDTRMAMPAIILMTVWKGLGYNMVLFLAGLQGVPQELRESARMDGANWWQEFTHVTLPMISPTTFFVLVMSLITSFQVFDQTWVLTKGGPQEATTTLVYYIYQTGFQNLRMGYASAIAYALFFLTLIVVMIQWRTQKRWVFYQ